MTIKTPQAGSQMSLPAIMPGVTTTRTTGVASAATAVLGARLVRLVCTGDCHIVFGVNPTATTADMLLPAGTVEYFVCDPLHKIGVIRTSADGILYITAAVEET